LKIRSQLKRTYWMDTWSALRKKHIWLHRKENLLHRLRKLWWMRRIMTWKGTLKWLKRLQRRSCRCIHIYCRTSKTLSLNIYKIIDDYVF
jgi:hypothetical protein